MDHNWIDILIRDRLTKTQEQEKNRRLAAIAESEECLKTFSQFCTELEEAVSYFNQENTDRGLGTLTCERHSDSIISIMRIVGDTRQGQVIISISKDRSSLNVLNQLPGQEGEDRLELRPQLDGCVYFWNQDGRMSASDAVNQVLRRFVLSIEY